MIISNRLVFIRQMEGYHDLPFLQQVTSLQANRSPATCLLYLLRPICPLRTASCSMSLTYCSLKYVPYILLREICSLLFAPYNMSPARLSLQYVHAMFPLRLSSYTLLQARCSLNMFQHTAACITCCLHSAHQTLLLALCSNRWFPASGSLHTLPDSLPHQRPCTFPRITL